MKNSATHGPEMLDLFNRGAPVLETDVDLHALARESFGHCAPTMLAAAPGNGLVCGDKRNPTHLSQHPCYPPAIVLLRFRFSVAETFA